MKSGKELLRLTVANLTCHAVAVTPDGKAIITGINILCLNYLAVMFIITVVVLAWDDGEIRAFYPESGKSMYTIHSAHNKVHNSSDLILMKLTRSILPPPSLLSPLPPSSLSLLPDLFFVCFSALEWTWRILHLPSCHQHLDLCQGSTYY